MSARGWLSLDNNYWRWAKFANEFWRGESFQLINDLGAESSKHRAEFSTTHGRHRAPVWIARYTVQRYSSSHSQGFKEENLGNSPGWWAATVANYCPSRPGELPQLLSSKPCEWSDAPHCRAVPISPHQELWMVTLFACEMKNWVWIWFLIRFQINFRKLSRNQIMIQSQGIIIYTALQSGAAYHSQGFEDNNWLVPSVCLGSR